MGVKHGVSNGSAFSRWVTVTSYKSLQDSVSFFKRRTSDRYFKKLL